MSGFGHFPYGHGSFGFGSQVVPVTTPDDPYEESILWPNLGNDLLLDSDDDLVFFSNDVKRTMNGLITLRQDTQGVFDTVPGNLFGHPNYGNSAIRLWGENYSDEWVNLMIRALTNAVTYNSAIYNRLKKDTIKITEKETSTPRSPRFNVSAETIADGETRPFNLVWGYNLDTFEDF